jgi:hypothetical protein
VWGEYVQYAEVVLTPSGQSALIMGRVMYGGLQETIMKLQYWVLIGMVLAGCGDKSSDDSGTDTSVVTADADADVDADADADSDADADADADADGEGVYPVCSLDTDCSADQFCGVQCWTGGCGADASIPAGTRGAFCQPCDECEQDDDAVSGSCDVCGGATGEDGA